MPSWKKHGLIFKLEDGPNRSNHTQVPTPYVFDDFIRLYYAGRKDGKSFPAYVDIDRKSFAVIKVNEEPIMKLGKPGMFDADGIMPSCVIENDDELWLYYIGWSELKNTARYQNEIGLAISEDGGETFERMFEGPIIGRSPNEPGLAVMPFVRQESSGSFSMWYQSGTGWHSVGDKYEPTYVIKYASSYDGIRWDRNPDQCIESQFLLQAFSRPCIAKIDGFDSMWYCARGSGDYRGGDGSYRIECAEALDKINFMRSVDMPKLFIGTDGEFDSHMQCYPYVIEIDGRILMFYNGNDFGQSGIGLAVWEVD